MGILHQSVQQKVQEEGFNALATKLSDYYQMETSYVRNDKEIIIILHLPGTKEIDLLMIYRYQGGGIAELVVRPPTDPEVRGSNLCAGCRLFELMTNNSN
jgi:hypothetical protein